MGWRARQVATAAGILALVLGGVPGARATTTATAVPAAGSITTFAGGVGDGPALDVAHRGPVDVVRRGTVLFIADQSVIRALDTTTGIERVVLGPVTGENIDLEGAAATETSAQSIAAIALDAAGNVYYSDSGRNRLRRIDVGTGLVKTIAGGGPSTPIPPSDGAVATAVYLDSPRGIAVDPSGNVDVVSRERVYRVDLSGRITTAVGGGPRSDHGPGPATEFDLMHPADVAFGPDGFLYVGGAYQTVRVSASGALSWFCCTPHGGAQGFIDVRTMAFDGAGNLWATGDGGTIRVIDPSGQYRDVPGSTSAGSIAVSPAGEVHVTGDEQRVWRIDTATGGRTAIAGSGLLYSGGDGRQATSAQLSGGNGIAADDAGNTYVSDGANRIRKVDPAGIITTFAGGPLEQGFSGDGGPATAARLYSVGAIAVGPDGVYFQDSLRIRRVDRAGVITTVAGTGEPGYTGDGGPAIEARFGPRPDHTDGFQGSPPIGLAFDGDGNLFVADSKAYVIRRIDRSGIITTVAGGGPSAAVDVPALGAWFEYPFGLAVSPDGRLTIADTYHDQVKVVDEAGMVRLALGGGRSSCPAHAPADFVSLLHPYGVAYDEAGNLYVADTGHHCVLRVDRQGQATTIAGRGVQGFRGDGGPALGSGFNTPLAVAVDGAGDLLVSEYDRVRKITGPARIGLPTSAQAWGWNYFGQVGDGTTADRRAPVPVAGLSDSVALAAGLFHTLSVQPDGTVRSWGFNALGQLGDGTTVDRPTATVVRGLSDVVAVAAGGYTSVALKADGTVWAWGWNGYGQVGDGTRGDRLLPTRVAGLTDVVAVASGALHNLALRRDGTVWTWGWNGVGQLGDGTTTDHALPAAVPGLAGVTLIGSGAHHSFAVSSNGWVYAWGWNAVGQLGTNWSGDFHSPTIITIGPNPSYPPVRQIVGGVYHSLALMADGTVYSWGWNGMGMLGDGTTQPHNRPALVPGAAGAISITAGLLHSVTGYADGSIKAWGWNGVGQLGDGTILDRLLPAPVPGLHAAGPAAAQGYSVVVPA